MQEFERSILENYDMEINSTRKIRGAVLCDTNQGWFLLKEVSGSQNRIPALLELYEILKKEGYRCVDAIEENKEHTWITEGEDGGKYVLKRWYDGRECDVRRPDDLVHATAQLAKLHLLMVRPMEHRIGQETHLGEIYERHGRELKKVRRYIRKVPVKKEFEYAFLEVFDQMYAWAQASMRELQNSSYDRLREDSFQQGSMVHGEYNYHNIWMRRDLRKSTVMAVTGFEKFHMDVQMEDLYYFLRKTMEKNGWKERLADAMLNAYAAIRPLSAPEMDYLRIRLMYPEKFWKVASIYYHSNKAWMPVKNVEKLKLAIRQMEQKKQFLKSVFSESTKGL